MTAYGFSAGMRQPCARLDLVCTAVSGGFYISRVKLEPGGSQTCQPAPGKRHGTDIACNTPIAARYAASETVSENALGQALQEFQLRQHLALAPRLQRSVKLLQMSAQEFALTVEQALATNPFLEEDGSPDDVLFGGSDSKEPALPSASQIPVDEATTTSERDYVRDNSTRADHFDPIDFIYQRAATPSLREHLTQGLSSYRISSRDRTLAALIIDAIGEDGYLRVPLTELCVDERDFDIPPQAEEWTTALRLVQQLDVPGLAARDLPECLTLQIASLTGISEAIRTVATAIVREHLSKLAKRDTAGIKRALQCAESDIDEACTLIRGLDPKPGLRYAEDTSSAIIPDVYVRKSKSVWCAFANRRVTPRARLHQTYADLFQQAKMDDRSPMAQELQEARWLVRNVEQRHCTIERVAQSIVKRQQRFFEYGDLALRPLMLKEIADELDLHESTVSRATSDKYMITPRGMFEFRHFFSRELTTDTGGTCSATAVRALIKGMIEEEDSTQPLSDVILQEQLASKGIVLARRTVSKYREQLHVPQAGLRRAG